VLLTQDEAKTKWCPHALSSDGGSIPIAINRSCKDGGPDHDCRCIASECMAWCWSDYAPEPQKLWTSAETEEEAIATKAANVGPTWELRQDSVFGGFYWQQPEAEVRAEVERLNRTTRRGFCGLAHSEGCQP